MCVHVCACLFMHRRVLTCAISLQALELALECWVSAVPQFAAGFAAAVLYVLRNLGPDSVFLTVYQP